MNYEFARQKSRLNGSKRKRVTSKPSPKPKPNAESTHAQAHVPGPERYINRELSWLRFNQRVLGEALDMRHPLLERVKFLAICSSNLDEFYMVRVAGIRQQIDAGVVERSPDGLLPQEQLALIKPEVEHFTTVKRQCWFEDVLPRLKEQGIHVLEYGELDDAQRKYVRQRFMEEIFPVLTPLAFDPGHPFPHISSLSLSLAIVVRDQHGGERFARVKVPEVLPRLLRVPADGKLVFTWIEQAIAAHVDTLFPGMQVVEAYTFRVTRDGDVDLQEEEAADLLRTIERGIRQRQFGRVVRLSLDQSMPRRIEDILVENMELKPDDVYHIAGPLGMRALMELYGAVDRPDLKDAPFVPHIPPPLAKGQDMFAAIQAGDILLHHPYDSFMPVVELIEQAAEDAQVLAIKQTLYRVGRNTPLVTALMRARENGKQVTVLVELKARFDEENNIEWAKQLERAGVHVVYGLMGLKTHCKVALIVRREREGIRRYVHLSTGNYNVTTAHLYTDIGLLTADHDLGADASDLFNYLTGYSAQRTYRKFFVAPVNLRSAMRELIDREIKSQRERGDGYLVFKMNTLTDPQMIDALYAAAAAGVKIDLIVRGVCCLRPGRTRPIEDDQGALVRRAFFGAQPDFLLRQRRQPRGVSQLGRPDEPQPRPARRNDVPGRRAAISFMHSRRDHGRVFARHRR